MDAAARGHPSLATPDDGTMWTLTHAVVVRNLMITKGDGGKSLWFTEFGRSTHTNPQQSAHQRADRDQSDHRAAGPSTRVDLGAGSAPRGAGLDIEATRQILRLRPRTKKGPHADHE